MSNPGFFTSTTAGSIGAENLVSEINTNAVTLLASTKLDNTAIPILLETANSHVHHTFLTQTEAINLMKGAVASVVKTSSTDSSHSHSVTITYDSLVQCFFATGASGGSPAHTHTGQPQNNTAIVPIYHMTANSHQHISWLTMREANDLINGTVASVVKNSSTNSFHAHSTTITWDTARSQFNAVSASAGSPAHVHATAAAAMSPFGSNFHQAKSEAESTTTSSTYQTKLTLTTGSLPLGDYVLFWTLGASNNSAKKIDVQVRQGSTQLRLIVYETSYQAAAGEYQSVNGFHFMSQISGVQTFDIRHRVPDQGTARIGDVHMMIFRVQ